MARRSAPLLCAFLLSVTPGSALASGSLRTWTASDGSLSFSYPQAWTLQSAGPGDDTKNLPLYLINGKPEPRDVADGELRIDFSSEPLAGRSLARLQSEDCHSTGYISIASCQIVNIHGQQWSWVAGKDTFGPPPGPERFLATNYRGHAFKVEGFVPDGPHQAQTFESMRRVLLSLRVGSTLPDTGSGPSSILALGLIATMVGVLCRRSALRRLRPLM